MITPKNGPAFVEALPVKRFHGVGPATAEKMHRHGIDAGADLKERTLPFLQQHFGKSGPWFYWIARGINERQVKPDRIRKSIGAEDTFGEDLHTLMPPAPARGLSSTRSGGIAKPMAFAARP